MASSFPDLAGSARGVVSVVGVSAGALTLALADPSTTRWYPPCVFHWLSGFECPGCGSLRAGHALLRGDVMGALGFNVLIVAVAPLVLWWFVRWLRPVPGRVQRTRFRYGAVVPVGVVALLFTVARNSGVEPLMWLAASR